jgi:hypothetical protein
MTNFEYYKDSILEMKDGYFGIKDEKPISCDDLGCSECEFRYKTISCARLRMRWLYKEYGVCEEPEIKLTKEEYYFLKGLAPSGDDIDYWIARDRFGVNVYGAEPLRENGDWYLSWDYEGVYEIEINSDLFKFITCEDEKSWSMRELLKLEVEE